MPIGLVRLNNSAIGEIAKSSDMMAAITDLADAVAGNVGAQGLVASSGSQESGENITAVVDSGISEGFATFNRARASVVIQHPAGLAMQVKHGVLTRAASMAGLEVKS